MQQCVGLDHIVDAAGRAAHRVHQARLRIHADVGLHAEIPLAALLALLHLRVAFTCGVLGRTRRSDQGGIHHRAVAQQQALGTQQLVDRRQDLRGQLVLFQQAAEAKNRGLVGQPGLPVQPCEVAEHRHVMQCLFHRRVAQREPLLHEVNTQHDLDSKRWPPAPSFGCVRRDQLDQRAPRHHFFHLRKEHLAPRLLALAGVLAVCKGQLRHASTRYRIVV